MRCEDCRELLWSYAKEELAQEIVPDVRAHLGSCRECAKELMYVRKMLQIVHELPIEELPPQYHTSLVKKLKREAKKLPKELRKKKKEKVVAAKAKPEPASAPVAEKEKVAVAKPLRKMVHEEESDRPFESARIKRKIHEEESDKLEAVAKPPRKMVHDEEEEAFLGIENVEGIEGVEELDELRRAELIGAETNSEKDDEKVVPLRNVERDTSANQVTSKSKIQEQAKTIKEKEKKKKFAISKRSAGVVAAAFLLLVAGGGYQLVNSLDGMPLSLNFGKTPSGVSYSGISASDMAEAVTDRPVADIPVDEFGNALPPENTVMARGNFDDMPQGGEFLDATEMNESNAADMLTGADGARGAIPQGEDSGVQDSLALAQDASQSVTAQEETTQEAMSFSNDDLMSDEADASTSDGIDSRSADANTNKAEDIDENIVVNVKNVSNAVKELIDTSQKFSGSSVDESNSGVTIVSLSPSDLELLVSELGNIGKITNVSVLNPDLNEKQMVNVGIIFYS